MRKLFVPCFVLLLGIACGGNTLVPSGTSTPTMLTASVFDNVFSYSPDDRHGLGFRAMPADGNLDVTIQIDKLGNGVRFYIFPDTSSFNRCLIHNDCGGNLVSWSSESATVGRATVQKFTLNGQKGVNYMAEFINPPDSETLYGSLLAEVTYAK